MLGPIAKWAALGAVLALAACGQPADRKAPAPTVATPLPAYYPADYSRLVEASKAEKGLLIYSNVAEYNWREILEGFKARYPWVKVATLDMGPAEVFERYYSEAAAKRPTSDLIVSGAPDAWQRFVSRKGLAAYESPEHDRTPAWSRPIPGLYTFSADPMVLIYNKVLLKPDEQPDSMAKLLALGAGDPKRFRDRFSTYDASSHPFAYAIHWSVVHERKPGGWEMYARLAPLTRPETGGATMLDKVTAGEYLAAYYTSAITVFPQMRQAGRDKIVGWALPKDGTPVMVRGMGVTRAAQNPASARLMLDYLLSREGQLAAAKGGMTPYRDDIAANEVPDLTYNEIVRRVGADKVVLVTYRPEMLSEFRPFIDQWNRLFRAVEPEDRTYAPPKA